MTDTSNPGELGGTGLGFTKVDTFNECPPPPPDKKFTYTAKAGASSTGGSMKVPANQMREIPAEPPGVEGVTSVEMVVKTPGVGGETYCWKVTDPATSIDYLVWHETSAGPNARGYKLSPNPDPTQPPVQVEVAGTITQGACA